MGALREYLSRHSYTEQFLDGNVKIELWAGLEATAFRDEILDNEFYEERGLFRYCLLEDNTPRIVAIVRYQGEIASYAMVTDDSDVMGRAKYEGSCPLGFLGVYTRPKYRDRGMAQLALTYMNRHLKRIEREIETKKPVCLLSNYHILSTMQKHIHLPVHGFEIHAPANERLNVELEAA